MPIDPYLSLAITPSNIDPLAVRRDRAAAEEAELKVRRLRQEFEDEQKLRALLAGADQSTIAKIAAINPRAAADLASLEKARQEALEAELKARNENLKFAHARAGQWAGMIGAIRSQEQLDLTLERGKALGFIPAEFQAPRYGTDEFETLRQGAMGEALTVQEQLAREIQLAQERRAGLVEERAQQAEQRAQELHPLQVQKEQQAVSGQTPVQQADLLTEDIRNWRALNAMNPEMSFRDYLAQKRERAPVPGVDIPFSPQVLQQKVELARAEERAKTEFAKPEKPAPLPPNAIPIFQDAKDLHETLERLLNSFRNDFAGNLLLSSAENFLGARLSPSTSKLLGITPGQAQWWQDYQSFLNIIRNQNFGAALTKFEINEFRREAINPAMTAEQVRQNLARRMAIAHNALVRIGNIYRSGNYNQDQINVYVPENWKEQDVAKKQKEAVEPPKAGDSFGGSRILTIEKIK